MQEIEPDKVSAFTKELITRFEDAHQDLCDELEMTGQLSDDTKEIIIQFAKEAAEPFEKKKEALY